MFIMTSSNDGLINKILEASEIISNNSRRGSANWMIASSQTAEFIGKVYNEHRAGLRRDKINRIYEKC